MEYTRSLFNVTDSVFDDGYRSLLRYADLLSISELEIHNNLAQQIIILLGQLFPNEEEVAISKNPFIRMYLILHHWNLLKQRMTL